MAWFDEEEKEEGLTDEQRALVNESIMKKMGPQPPSERDQLEANIDAAAPAGWRRGLMAAGGGNVRDLYVEQDQARQKLKDFDAKQELKRADAQRVRDEDPTSEESRTMQALAAKMMPGRDFSKIPASKLKTSMPSLEKLYSVEQNRLGRIDSQRAAADTREQARLDRNALKEQARQDRLEREARLSEKQVEGITDFDDSVNRAQAALTALGDNDNFVGLLDSKVPDLMVGSDQVAFRAAVGRMSDAYRKLITGAGASNLELARLESRLPKISDTPADFKAKANDFIKEVKQAKATHLSNYKKSGKNTKEFEEPEAPKQVKVSNGSETLMIDEADLADAQKDGYSVVP